MIGQASSHRGSSLTPLAIRGLFAEGADNFRSEKRPWQVAQRSTRRLFSGP